MNFSDNKKLLYGPIAGIFESIAMQPVDTIKVLKQSNQFNGLRNIMLENPKILYKGFTPFTSQMFVKYFLRFTAFEIFKSNSDKVHENFRAGILAGFTESIFITPFELIKTQLQTSQKNKPISVIKDIIKDKG